MIQVQQVSDAAVRDTLTAVFSSEQFSSVARETILTRIANWVGEFFRELAQLTGGSRVLYYTVLAATIGLIAAIVARAIYVANARGLFTRGPGRAFAGGVAGSSDPWSLAQRLAAEGDYTGAAHALYGAILLNVSQSGLVRLHDAKTIGDYIREMRARASAGLLQPFREFARSYEYVVYGVGECDRPRYERLYGLATQIVGNG